MALNVPGMMEGLTLVPIQRVRHADLKFRPHAPPPGALRWARAGAVPAMGYHHGGHEAARSAQRVADA